ncbi:NAD-dependent epimerase/dehydratase family protein [Nocardioides lijunqiniae]|uniref:NAD-dependent epimerase/dehydratase family protein n=1 Tax=Nocardioides lijunqiniae TaxID=2760832 RepID=UPI001878ACFE|nr:NAD(P)-dependent oxidoreductase [Nocardioides lijunqiniae]
MRIFLAGGTGVIGRRLVPRLLAAGHEVVATTRHLGNVDRIERSGATGVVVDVYDSARLTELVATAAPDLVIHQLSDLRHYDTRATARIRREGTRNLVAAAHRAGVGRIVVQSIAWAYEDGHGLADEDEPVEEGSAVAAMEDLARTLAGPTILRFGWWYGPGTWYAEGGRVADAVAEGLLPATRTVNSFVHIDDAVSATLQAIHWPAGAYNIVDDEPAPATEWLPVYARSIGAPAPTSTVWAHRSPGGRGASNAKARAAGWTPRHPTWRSGFGATGPGNG